ncbi:Ppx/GppA phosphatase family [Corynebacterium pseudotuberculosis 1/06-A]|nr:Ppx/GppA phosphatase family [Corynebacterium pseudotuberculosis 1/06-A]
MRLGVLDVGSNTAHLVAVDAQQGGRPTPMSDWKTTLKLVGYLDKKGAITAAGVDKLVDSVAEAAALAQQLGCEELMPFATSAVRSATNSDEVLAEVARHTGINLEVLSGTDEAKLTFLAVRRWYGWSAGRIINLDIGGGSSAADRAELEGVSANRSQQIVAGALVAEAAMRALGIEHLEICPWALREGVILRRMEQGIVPKETPLGEK